MCREVSVLVPFRHSWIVDCLLLMSGDIALNPGLVWFPCSVCVRSVHSNQRALQCDICQQWIHAACGGVSVEKYQHMSLQMDFFWCCPPCLLVQLPFSTDDSFNAPLSSIDVSTDYDDSLPIISDVLCVPCSKLRLVHHNVQGLRSKWDDLSDWMAKSAVSGAIFCFSEIWMKSEMMQLQMPRYQAFYSPLLN